MLRALLILLALTSSAHALPHGGATSPIVGSPSAVTIFMTWNTASGSTSSGGCDTTPNSFAKSAIILDGGGSVTAHSAIVAGLVPATLYYCKGSAGGVDQLFQMTTLAAPVTVALVSATIGSPTTPLSGQNTGDTYGNTISTDGKVYLTEDDGASWVGSGGTGQPFPMVMGTLTASFIGTNVNTFSNFTAHGEPPKLFGAMSYLGVLYSSYSNLCSSSGASEVCSTGSSSFFGQMWGGLLKDHGDHGATWANWQNPASYSAGGTVPSPYNGVTMWDGSSGCSQSSPITYGADNGTVLPTYRIDNADAYDYYICGQPLGDAGTADGSQFNKDSIYLARWPWASHAALDKTTIQYFIGGPTGNGINGSLDGAWSSSYSGAAPLVTNTAKVSGYSFMHYMPSTGRYVWMDWYWNDPGTFTSSTWLIYENDHPWPTAGHAWTLISTSTYSPQGWYAPASYMPTTLAATLGGAPMQMLTAGAFLNSSSCPSCFYQLNVIPVTFH